MGYFILISWVSHITISTPYDFTIIKSSVIKQFNILCIFLLIRSYSITMKNLLPNIYLLNTKQGLKAHLNLKTSKF